MLCLQGGQQSCASTGTTQLCGWEVKAAVFKLTLIKRIQYSLLITLHALNSGQAG